MLENGLLTDYINTYHPRWTIDMPTGCPPNEICVPFAHAFYRLASDQNSYSEKDFLSYAELNPKKDWGEMLPLAVGLSVLDNEKKAKNSLRLPYLKQYKGIIALTLNPTDGVAKQTGVHKSHYTWWRTTHFKLSDLKMLAL